MEILADFPLIMHLVENHFKNKFGCFFQVVDKRVSRNHGILELEDGKLYLTPVRKKSISEKNVGTLCLLIVLKK